MPLPKTKDVGKVMSFLKKEKPQMDKKQRIAIALSQARKSGADIPKPKRDNKGNNESPRVRAMKMEALKRKMQQS